MQVLVVDDNLLSSTTILSQLHTGGHRPALAGTEADALRTLRDTSFDFVLINLAAHRFDPVSLISTFRKTPELKTCRIVGFCGHLEHARRKAAQEAGCDHVMTNAVALRQLTTALETF